MILIDASVLIDVLRDKRGSGAAALLDLAGDREIVLSRFSELELLMGAIDDTEWKTLAAYVANRTMLEPSPLSWQNSARIYFDLRRQGKTVRSTVDCCIAQLALERNILLLHNDRDFDAIATVRPLKHLRLDLSKANP